MRKTFSFRHYPYEGLKSFFIVHFNFILNDYNRNLSLGNITNKMYDRKTKKYDYYKLPTILRSKGVKVTIKYYRNWSEPPYKVERFNYA